MTLEFIALIRYRVCLLLVKTASEPVHTSSVPRARRADSVSVEILRIRTALAHLLVSAHEVKAHDPAHERGDQGEACACSHGKSVPTVSVFRPEIRRPYLIAELAMVSNEREDGMEHTKLTTAIVFTRLRATAFFSGVCEHVALTQPRMMELTPSNGGD